ncbi:MAG: methyl-accepting chemotaxis protein [Lachnospiraceae bacterium]|nr:methyl-accepting chemotaxis protein [Lachnospiraceae bacterium]
MKRNGKLINRIIYIALSVIVVVAGSLTFIAGYNLKHTYFDMYEEQLKTGAIQLRDEFEEVQSGAWNSNSVDPVMKGGHVVGKEIEKLMDRLHAETGVDYTLFIGKTRAITTIIKKGTADERIVGTDAAGEVVEACLNGGNNYFAQHLVINEKKYCAYYIPIKQESGEVIGMVFAGTPSDTADKAISRITSTMIAIAVILTAAVLAGGLFIASKTSKKMRDISNVLEQVAEGSLNVDADSTLLARKDELGSITESYNTLKTKLTAIIRDTANIAGKLKESGTELSTSADQAADASAQVTEAIDEISKGAVSQAESIETATTDTANIGEDIDEITAEVKQLDEAASDMKASCDNAMGAMNELIKQNENVTGSVKEISETIDSTNQSARSIDTFSQAITDIATQTNLLSLNASIEAARAGEAGRGFAVVADEIRALADQSKDSADKIKSIVNRLLADSEASVSVMQKLQDNFSAQSLHLDSTRMDMQHMMENVTHVSESSGLISERIAKLEASKESLLSIISDLSAISEENAASTEETNASMEELNATFSIISRDAADLRALAEELNKTISFFKLG